MTVDLQHNAVAESWDRNADQWTHDVRAGYDVYRDLFTFPAFQSFLPPLGGLEVIDFGCGEGTNTRAFARMGARMTGIDISEKLLAHARAKEDQEPLGIAYRQSSYSADTGFEAGRFDAAVSTLALMDGPDFDGAMREAFRLIRPGGFLAFSILHPCFITPGLHWERDADGQAVALCASRYFDRSTFTENWKFGDRPKDEPVELFAVPRFPRTLSDYLNGVAGAGFRIRTIGEPRPSDAACEAAPRFRRWRDLGAFLLMVLADRPA